MARWPIVNADGIGRAWSLSSEPQPMELGISFMQIRAVARLGVPAAIVSASASGEV